MTRFPLPGPAILFCPADRPDRYAKAAGAADAVIIDLQDAVAPDRKSTARDALRAALDGLDQARTIVRVNETGSPWLADDLALLDSYPDLPVMLPMVSFAAEVRALAPRPVIALCETAAGVLAAPDIARAANCQALMWGSEDLANDLGARRAGARAVLDHARWTVLFAARAAGLLAIDTVCTEIRDTDVVRADAEEAAAAGFLAKACVHPSQVASVRAAFTATPEELAWAHGVLAAATTGGVFRHGGTMVDAPVLARARSILHTSEPTGRPSR